MAMVKRLYKVLKRSWINGSLCNAGSIVTIEHDDKFVAGKNLELYVAPPSKPVVPPAGDEKPQG